MFYLFHPPKELKMKAYLINPKEQTITEVDYNGDFQSIYPLLGPKVTTFDVVPLLGGDGLYVDDEGLWKEEQIPFSIIRNGFLIEIVNNALLLGCDEEGETVAPTMSIEQLKTLVMWRIQ